jgi:thioredoxin 1
MSRAARTALALAAIAALVAGSEWSKRRRDAPAGPAAAGSGRPRVVDVGATTCIPCRKMAPILADLKREYAGRADIVFIDVWENPDAGDSYRIRGIPTQVFFDARGQEVWRHEGFLDRPEIVARLRAMGVE